MLVRAHVSLDRVARALLHTGLVAAPLALGGKLPAAIAILQLLVLAALACWFLGMVRQRELAWRRTSPELPLAMLLALVAVQIAIGNGTLASWALGPPGTGAVTGVSVPTPVFTIGTISSGATWRSFLLFLTYACVYVLVVHLFTRRRHLEALLRTLLIAGTVLAVVGLAEYFAREAGVLQRGEAPRRVLATFANPDHFGAWLNLIAFLGLGQLLASGSGARRGERSLKGLSLSEAFEDMGRRYATVMTLLVLVLALVFTLSRGAILSFVVALAVVLVLTAAIGRARRTFAAVGVLLVLALAYAIWLGLDPFLARFNVSDMQARWNIWTATIPMIRDFPLLGIGLGTYQEISPRYQTPSLLPGVLLINQAHNDWLQLWVELGPLGLILGVWAVVRVTRDLVGAHLIGRGRCQVGGGEQDWARRNDPFSVGIAVGAIGGVVALLVHSLVDFSARLPAVGMLAAASLGIATVALHNRFGSQDALLSARVAWPLDVHRVWATRIAALALAGVAAVVVIRPAVADLLVTIATREPSPRLAEAAAAIDGSDVPALIAHADARVSRARLLWVIGALAPGQGVAPVEDRRRDAAALLHEAITTFRSAIAGNPTAPATHDRLAWAYLLLAAIEPSAAKDHTAQALAHMQRAVALDPEHAFRYEALARLTVAAYPYAPIEVGLGAARAAIARKPGVRGELVYEFLLLPLTDAQWVALVPETVAHRLLLADTLEQRGLRREAIGVYRKAVETAAAQDGPLARWMLALALARHGDPNAAVRELGVAAQVDADNPEIFLAVAEALDATRDPVALDMYRIAVAKAEERARHGHKTETSFRLFPPPLEALVARRLGPLMEPPPVRYHRALARHLAERELYQQAMREIDAVVTHAPRDPLIHFLRGTVLEGLGQMDAAVEAYTTAVALDERNVKFRLRLARVLRDTKQPYQAMNHWTAVLGVEPNNLEAALSLARAYDQTGAKAEAMRAYEVVLRIAPDSAEARRALNRFGWIER